MSAIHESAFAGKYHVNGLLPNMPDFEQAFSRKAGPSMAKENRCRIW
jgi:endothelin-converting enzyme/putative endopeptidase